MVRQDSPIRTVAQLKGQRVKRSARARGRTTCWWRRVAEAGLSVRDIEPAYLTPADARAAFERGSVAAWVIWDPFLAAVQRQASARILRDGTKLASYRRFYLAATPYAKRRPDVLAVVDDEQRRAGDWIKRNPGPAAVWHAPLISLDPRHGGGRPNLRRT